MQHAATKAPPLEKIRRSRSLSQHALAQASGVHRNTISRIERGYSTNIGILARLAAALGVEVFDLCGFSPVWHVMQDAGAATASILSSLAPHFSDSDRPLIGDALRTAYVAGYFDGFRPDNDEGSGAHPSLAYNKTVVQDRRRAPA